MATTCDNSGSVWGTWVYSDSGTTSSTCDAWDTWNTTTATTTTDNTAGTVWYTWQGDYNNASVPYYIESVGRSQEKIDKAEKKRKDNAKRSERRYRKIMAKRRFPGGLTDKEKKELRAKKSEDRAKQLLLDLIGEDELKVYEETGRLFVKGRKHDYVIRRDKFIGGLERIGKNKITDLCVHIQTGHKCPKTDNVLALKLALEDDEDRVLNMANNHGSRNRPAEMLKAACM